MIIPICTLVCVVNAAIQLAAGNTDSSACIIYAIAVFQLFLFSGWVSRRGA